MMPIFKYQRSMPYLPGNNNETVGYMPSPDKKSLYMTFINGTPDNPYVHFGEPDMHSVAITDSKFHQIKKAVAEGGEIIFNTKEFEGDKHNHEYYRKMTITPMPGEFVKIVLTPRENRYDSQVFVPVATMEALFAVYSEMKVS